MAAILDEVAAGPIGLSREQRLHQLRRDLDDRSVLRRLPAPARVKPDQPGMGVDLPSSAGSKTASGRAAVASMSRIQRPTCELVAAANSQPAFSFVNQRVWRSGRSTL